MLCILSFDQQILDIMKFIGGENMDEKKLGQYLKELRKSYNYTQEYVASHLDVSRQAYSHYETNRAIPSNDAFYKIANLYGVPIEPLIELSVLSDESFHYGTSAAESNELSKFLDYINDERNVKKLQYLSRKEKELLYYFNTVLLKDQNEILEILKIKIKAMKE